MNEWNEMNLKWFDFSLFAFGSTISFFFSHTKCSIIVSCFVCLLSFWLFFFIFISFSFLFVRRSMFELCEKKCWILVFFFTFSFHSFNQKKKKEETSSLFVAIHDLHIYIFCMNVSRKLFMCIYMVCVLLLFITRIFMNFTEFYSFSLTLFLKKKWIKSSLYMKKIHEFQIFPLQTHT